MASVESSNPGRRVDDSAGSILGRGLITQNADGKLKAPKNIILSVEAAKSYYHNARSSHVDRIRLYAAIMGLIAGNPPYDAAELEKAGLQHIANVNMLDAQSLFERTALTFWNLIHQNAYLVKFRIRNFKGQEDQDYSAWAEILSRNWTEVINEMWTDFTTEFNTTVAQLVMLGLSPVLSSDEHDFRWKSVEISRFFVPEKASSNTSEWDYVCIETPYQMQYLWGVYDTLLQMTPEAREESPWNMTALESFLVNKANAHVKAGGGSAAYPNAVELQYALQSGTINSAAVFSDTVSLVTLLYKEYSGKISHYIFDPLTQGTGVNDFLFQVSEQYNEFKEALIVFTYSAGERYLHGNRGVGHKIFPACQALMQLDGHLFDMSKMASTVIVETSSTLGREVQPIRVIPGTVTDIGQAKLAQNNLGGNMGQVVQTAQYLERKVNRNAQISGDDPSGPDVDRGSKSAPEIQMQSVKEFGVGKKTVAHFYKTFDILLQQMTGKMLHCKDGYPGYEIVKEWKDRCIDEGVPKEIFALKGAEKNKLPKHLSVRASRVAGDGSNLGLIMGLKSVGGIAGGFPEKGQFHYRTDIINSALGIDYVDRYLGTAREPDEAQGGASLAALENFMIDSGQMPQTSRDNQHKSHIGSHFAKAMQIIQQVQAQEIDPVTADGKLSMLIPHLQEHIQFVAEDSLNVNFLQQIQPQFKQIFKFAQLNRVKSQNMQKQEVRRRQQEEEKLTAEQLEQNRKDMAVQRDQERSDYKVKSQVERAKEASATRAEIMRKGVEAKAENERLAIKLKADNEGQKNRIKEPKEILAPKTTAEIQSDLQTQVGSTPNPADFS